MSQKTPSGQKNDYLTLASEAAQQENAGLWSTAAALWERAALCACPAQDRVWATCRADVCRRRDAYRRSAPFR